MVVICATLMGAPPAEAAVAPDVPLDEPLDEEAHAEAPRASATVAAKARDRRMARLLSLDIMNLRFCAVPQMLSYLQDFCECLVDVGVVLDRLLSGEFPPFEKGVPARGIAQLEAYANCGHQEVGPVAAPERGAARLAAQAHAVQAGAVRLEGLRPV